MILSLKPSKGTAPSSPGPGVCTVLAPRSNIYANFENLTPCSCLLLFTCWVTIQGDKATPEQWGWWGAGGSSSTHAKTSSNSQAIEILRKATSLVSNTSSLRTPEDSDSGSSSQGQWLARGHSPRAGFPGNTESGPQLMSAGDAILGPGSKGEGRAWGAGPQGDREVAGGLVRTSATRVGSRVLASLLVICATLPSF